MQIDIKQPVEQTFVFIALLLLSLVLTFRKKHGSFFDISQTNELKGFAMLAIIFSHTGYFLVSDHRFLYPLSILAGTGVNIFLFLSGFGLTFSALKSSITTIAFYKKRLDKLLVPFWITLAILFLMDAFLLSRSYNLTYITHSFLGFFPSADLFLDIDSPLWYFTVILFYYLVFPLLFIKRFPYFGALLIFILSILILKVDLPINKDVVKLYKLHTMAFPLGMVISYIFYKYSFIENLSKVKLKWILIPILALVSIYTSINSDVGQNPLLEQSISILSLTCIALITLLKGFKLKFLEIFGLFSYEIYLIHWPILSRYDIFYRFIPASLATCLYLLLFLGVAFILTKGINLATKKIIQA